MSGAAVDLGRPAARGPQAIWRAIIASVSPRILLLICLIIITGAVFSYLAPNFLTQTSIFNVV